MRGQREREARHRQRPAHAREPGRAQLPGASVEMEFDGGARWIFALAILDMLSKLAMEAHTLSALHFGRKLLQETLLDAKLLPER